MGCCISEASSESSIFGPVVTEGFSERGLHVDAAVSKIGRQDQVRRIQESRGVEGRQRSRISARRRLVSGPAIVFGVTCVSLETISTCRNSAGMFPWNLKRHMMSARSRPSLNSFHDDCLNRSVCDRAAVFECSDDSENRRRATSRGCYTFVTFDLQVFTYDVRREEKWLFASGR